MSDNDNKQQNVSGANCVRVLESGFICSPLQAKKFRLML